MSGERNILRNLTWHIQQHILGTSGVFLLLQGNFNCLYLFFNQRNSILGIDIDTGDDFSLAHKMPQFPLVNVPVRKIGIAIIGDKAQGTAVKHIMVDPIAQITVDHNDFSLALAQRIIIQIPQVVKGRLHFPTAGTQIAFAGNLHAVSQKFRFLNLGHGHRERLDFCFQTHLRKLLAQIFCRFPFLRTAAGTDIGSIPENFHDVFCMHNLTSFP